MNKEDMIHTHNGILRACVCALSHFSYVWLFVTWWDCSPEAPLFMGFSKQEYWSGLPRPLSGDHPNPWIKPASPALQIGSLPLSHRGSPNGILLSHKKE